MTERAPHPAKCAVCQSSDTAYLPYISARSWAWYYRCLKCGHVWTIEKNDAVDSS
jgi:uncharacterized Zn finger protein